MGVCLDISHDSSSQLILEKYDVDVDDEDGDGEDDEDDEDDDNNEVFMLQL